MDEYEITTAGTREMTTLLEWAEDEGWNPGKLDRLPFHAADPHGFFMGKLDAEPVTSVSAVRYGADYGFIGFYIASPPVRGQGYGIQAWRAAMNHLGAGTWASTVWSNSRTTTEGPDSGPPGTTCGTRVCRTRRRPPQASRSSTPEPFPSGR